jgi:hypothetical protein
MKDEDKSFEEALKNLKSTDFDGHTEFSKLTLEQRLLWLSQMAKVIWLARQSNASKKT